MATTMSDAERILWEYLDEESDELILRLRDNVVVDGFASEDNTETVVLKMLAHATMKVIAIMCEKTEHPSIGLAYMQTIPMVTELVKFYVLKDARQRAVR